MSIIHLDPVYQLPFILYSVFFADSLQATSAVQVIYDCCCLYFGAIDTILSACKALCSIILIDSYPAL